MNATSNITTDRHDNSNNCAVATYRTVKLEQSDDTSSSSNKGSYSSDIDVSQPSEDTGDSDASPSNKRHKTYHDTTAAATTTEHDDDDISSNNDNATTFSDEERTLFRLQEEISLLEMSIQALHQRRMDTNEQLRQLLVQELTLQQRYEYEQQQLEHYQLTLKRQENVHQRIQYTIQRNTIRLKRLLTTTTTSSAISNSQQQQQPDVLLPPPDELPDYK